jgi:hypothetical protein
MRVTRQSVLGAGKTPNWAGVTPPLAAFSRPKTSWGRSSPVFEAVPARTQDGHIIKEERCRSSINRHRS